MEKHHEIGQRLLSVRGILNLSQRALADELGLSLMGYQNYEMGKRVPPGVVLAKLSELSGVAVDYLLTGKGMMYVNYVAEAGSAYAVDDVTIKVMDMMKNMDKKGRADVLKYVEAQKLWQEKKLKEGS